MSKPSFKTLVFIGRFQPLHSGHVHVMQKALAICERLVVLVGSSNRSRSAKNPFSYAERQAMISAALPEDAHVSILPLPDTLYNDRLWVKKVEQRLEQSVGDGELAVVGHSKDESTYYLESFPDWGFEEIENFEGLNATDVRETFFRSAELPSEGLPQATCQFLQAFKATEDYRALVEEQDYIDRYAEAWSKAPYPPVFVTVDALVRYGDECLFIRRGNAPALGLLAMPGGFLDPDERALDAAIRELREETCLEVPYETLMAGLMDFRFFDHPSRSVRKRTVTQAFYFDLSNHLDERPCVRANDDAAAVTWINVSQVDESDDVLDAPGVDPLAFAEDHFFMLAAFLMRWPAVNALKFSDDLSDDLI